MSSWKLFTCNSRCRVCERGHLGDWTCDPRYMVLRGGVGNHTGECGHVTPGTGPGRRGHPGGSGPVTPGAGSWRGLTLGDMDECSQVQGQGGRQPGNCRYLTPDTVSGWGFTRETVDMRPRCRIWVGMSSWIFCKCDLRYRV